jgi:hypothetical protein
MVDEAPFDGLIAVLQQHSPEPSPSLAAVHVVVPDALTAP